ncbi:hypothetical protein BC830DRAFT_930663 [Chytriomyces sp. MP71]|nr:hypothetical protein BC830DRAFT_930663 [Chytriomyces sp. MP71]
MPRRPPPSTEDAGEEEEEEAVAVALTVAMRRRCIAASILLFSAQRDGRRSVSVRLHSLLRVPVASCDRLLSNSVGARRWHLWKDLMRVVEDPQNSSTVTLLHAIYCAFFYRRSHSFQHGRIVKGVLVLWLIGLGGSTLAAVLAGKPPGWVLNNNDLLLYASGYFIVCRTPVVFPVMNAMQPFTEAFFDILDVALRAIVLQRIQKEVQALAPSTSTIPQIALGTLSCTGGGIIYDYSFSHDLRFQYPGYDFTVVFLTNLFYAWNASSLNRRALINLVWNSVLLNPLRGLMSGSPLFGHTLSIAQSLIAEWARVLGVPITFKGKRGEDDLRLLCAALMMVGFWLRPGKWVRSRPAEEEEDVKNSTLASRQPEEFIVE